MFGRLFGGGNKNQSPVAPGGGGSSGTSATINAMQGLTEREEQLEKKKALLEKKIADEVEKAREFTRQKKQAQALMCLKKKKMYEQQMANIDALVQRVMEQKNMLEDQQTTLAVLSDMDKAAKAQKRTMADMKMENVDETLDQIREVGDQMREITEAIAQPMGAYADLDDDELNAELAQMQQEELDSQLLTPAPVPATKVAGTTTALPNVPTSAVKHKTKEEEELEALQAEMAL